MEEDGKIEKFEVYKSNKVFAEELKKDHRIVDVFQTDIEIDKENSLNLLKARGLSDELLEDAGFVIDFLNGPMITDTFENHTLRREWRVSLRDELYQFYRKNKLRRNVLFSTLFFVKNLAEKSGNEKEQKQLIDIESKLLNYDAFALEQKIEIVNELDRIANAEMFNLIQGPKVEINNLSEKQNASNEMIA